MWVEVVGRAYHGVLRCGLSVESGETKGRGRGGEEAEERRWAQVSCVGFAAQPLSRKVRIAQLH